MRLLLLPLISIDITNKYKCFIHASNMFLIQQVLKLFPEQNEERDIDVENSMWLAVTEPGVE